MKIRRALLLDSEQIAQVHVNCWKTSYRNIVPDEFLDKKLSWERSKKNWENTLNNFPDSIFLVAEDDCGKIVGFCAGGKNRDMAKNPQFIGELMGIYILEKYQKKGLGTQLVEKFVNELQIMNIQNMIIWALKKSKYKKFYEKLGGHYVDEKNIEIGGKKLNVVAYGFEKLKNLSP
ncbi:MAG: GNAT family N-acetyltransferase [Candidatus Cloacimonetes bacterium]|nr:GNAT family N-acetyltransferase [Candidatus Cloacimonadota bacterium]